MTALTEATYRIEIRYRGTDRPVPNCGVKRGQRVDATFNRVLDGQSSAGLLINSASDVGMCSSNCGDGCPCIPIARKHKLAFLRDDEIDPVWEGPITGVTGDGSTGGVSIRAVDNTYWWEGAPFQRGVVGNFTVDELFRRYTGQADEYQPSGLERRDQFVTVSPNDIEVDHGAGEEINGEILSLAKNLLDYTVVGKRLYYGTPEIPLKDGPPILSSTSLAGEGPITVDTDGSEVGTKFKFIGANGVTAEWPEVEVDRGYGLRTIWIADTNVDDPNEALARVKAVHDANIEPQQFLVTGGNTLSAAFPGTLRTLVPGRYFPVAADTGCVQTVAERRRLNLVNVNIQSTAENGWSLKEKRVAVDFSPANSEGAAQAVSV